MANGISTLGQSLAQIERLKTQQLKLNNLTQQLSSGKKTQKFSGLNTDVLVSKRARATLNTTDNYINNIKIAERRISLTLNTIEEFKQQAENFSNALIGFLQEGTHQKGEIVYFDDPVTPDEVERIPVGMTSAEPDIDLSTLQDLAGNIFDLMADLMNERDGERYLMAGAQTLSQPIDNAGLVNSALDALLKDWKNGAITTNDLIADIKDRTTNNGNPDAITDTIIGYSSELSSGNTKDIFVRTDEKEEINYTVLANEDPFRDMLVVTAYFRNDNLPPIADQVDPETFTVLTEGAPGANVNEQKENFYAIFEEMAKMVGNAIDELDARAFKLENAKVRLDEAKRDHTQQRNVLLATIGDTEDADINEVALQINSLSIQLDASYRVTARVSELSLVNFI